MNWTLLKNSLFVSALTTLLAVAFGFFAALFLAGLDWRRRRWWIGGAIIGLALPPFLVTGCWLHLLGLTGVWHTWLPLDIYSLGGTVWVLSLMLWPISLLFILGAWQRLEPGQLECEVKLTGWPLIRRLLVPLARNALAQSAVLTFVLALNNFAVPSILQVKVFPVEVWVEFNSNLNISSALATSWPLVLAPLLLLCWLRGREFSWPRLEQAVSGRTFRRQLGAGWFWAGAVFAAGAMFLSVGLPLSDLCASGRTWLEFIPAFKAGQGAALNSAVFSMVTAALVVGVALVSWRWPLGVVLWLPFLVPGVLVGFVLIGVFNSRGLSWFYESVGIVFLAWTLRYMAVGWNTTAHAMRSVDRDLSDSARLEGASRWQLLRHVHWPQVAPQLAVAWYLTYLFCLWDAETLILIMPPGAETLSVRVFNFLHYGHNPQVNALCLILLLLAVAPLALFLAIGTGRQRHSDRNRNDAFGQQDNPHPDPLPSDGRGNSLIRLLHFLQRLDTPTDGGRFSLSHLRGYVFSVSRFRVPQGRSKIAQRFIAGLSHEHKSSPDRDERTHHSSPIISVAPPGLWPFSTRNPRLKPWATFGRPYRDFGVSGKIVLLSGALSLIGLIVGCSPATPADEAPVESKFFSRVKIIGTRGAGLGEFNKPRSVTVDAQDNLYAVDMTGRVQKFSPDGTFLSFWQMPQTDKGNPKGMCRDDKGNVVVLEPHYSRVNHYTPEGKLVAQWGVHGTNAGQLAFPRSVIANSRGDIFVSEYGLAERVQQFASQGGTWVRVLGRGGEGDGEFNRAEGLGIDAQDRLYVADSCHHRIQVFSPDGKFLATYGRAGSGPGEMSYPYDVKVDGQGFQFVCEFGNSRIQIFDAQRQPVELLGGPGAAPGQFSNPWGIAIDSKGNLYVADAMNHRVQKFIRRDAMRARSKGVVSGQLLVVGRPLLRILRHLKHVARSAAYFPLTLTLSLREREQQAANWFSAEGRSADSSAGMLAGRRTILPIPEGEGRGEGNPRVANPTVQSESAAGEFRKSGRGPADSDHEPRTTDHGPRK